MLRVEEPKAPLELPLIEFQWYRAHPLNPTWERWFETAGMELPTVSSRLRFSDETHAIQSAIAGQGVALVSLPLVAAELASGQLTQLFEQTLPSHRHHLFVKDDASPTVLAVAEWVIMEARAMAM